LRGRSKKVTRNYIKIGIEFGLASELTEEERSFSVFTQLLLFFEIFLKNICLEYSED